ncbi:MAG TPA: hypothetical protein VM052_08930 [Candidatus Limnocylindrales bacterium]|nr:hypothetical protein [Candidatus Limnocylindrales bacterium]
MRDNEDLRSLLQSLGSAAIGIGLGFAVLVAGFFVSEMSLASSTTVAAVTSTPAPSATAPTSGTVLATLAPTAPPTVAPSVAPTATPVPTPTKDPLTVSAYSNGGLRYAALTLASAPYTMTSPVAGVVSIAIYQFIDGEVRVGANDPTQPSFPYVTVTSADRRLRIRPGSTQSGVKLLVEDGQRVAAGDALFTLTGLGPSSWNTFYDRNVSAQIIASVATLGGAEMDPVPVFRR